VWRSSAQPCLSRENTLDAAVINDKFPFSMKVLIAGICGFVGSALARRIRETTPGA